MVIPDDARTYELDILLRTSYALERIGIHTVGELRAFADDRARAVQLGLHPDCLWEQSVAYVNLLSVKGIGAHGAGLVINELRKNGMLGS